jgi:hypothetical protein
MVEGWFLGRLIGSISVPNDRQSTDPVQVWDTAHDRWVAFPNPLMSSPRSFRSADDWLPAVLESQVLAIVQCNNDVTLSALRPYVALRSISDDSQGQPQGGFGDTSGDRLLEGWLRTGQGPSGHPPQVGDLQNAATMTREERAAAALRWLTLVSDHISKNYLTDGAGVGAMATRKARVNDVTALARMPMFGEIAELTLGVVLGIAEKVERAEQSGGSGGNIF